jgi:hypothetical protein
MNVTSVLGWVVAHKFWLIAFIPVALAVIVLKLRG